jgi:hypothetical protein
MIKRYDIQWFNNSAKIAEKPEGVYVLYVDHAARIGRLSALILKVLDCWWPFVHGTHASNAARNLRVELGDAIQPDSYRMNQYQRFELWYAERFGEACEQRNGHYIEPAVRLMWECWQKAVDQYE